MRVMAMITVRVAATLPSRTATMSTMCTMVTYIGPTTAITTNVSPRGTPNTPITVMCTARDAGTSRCRTATTSTTFTTATDTRHTTTTTTNTDPGTHSCRLARPLGDRLPALAGEDLGDLAQRIDHEYIRGRPGPASSLDR